MLPIVSNYILEPTNILPVSVKLNIGTCNIDFSDIKHGTWSNWRNRDNPWSGYSDTERIEDFATDYGRYFEKTDLCINPIAAQSRILGSTNMSTTENVQFSLKGLECKNFEQTSGRCSDYEVRFCCPQKGEKTIIFE